MEVPSIEPSAAIEATDDSILASATSSRGFVYLLALADKTAFHIGACRDPLRSLRSLAPRFQERFDLAASVLMQVRSIDAARRLEAQLKQAFARSRTRSPIWLTPDARAHAEWFEASQFNLAQQRLNWTAQRTSTGIVNGVRLLASDLIEQRPKIESWAFGAAKELNAHVAYSPGEGQLQLARALRDWWDLFLHLHVPLFAQHAEQSDFVYRMVRLYRPALMDRY